MSFVPYLAFDGRCREAFDAYAAIFGGEITFRTTFGESPMAAELPPNAHDRIMHSQLDSPHGALMGADCPQSMPSTKGCVNITVDTPAEAERVFHALAEGGQVQMPIGETFWAQRFGMLADRYGHAWMVNCLKPMG